MSNNIITVDIIIKYVPDCGDSVLLASEDKLLSILLLPARLGRLASVPAGLVVNTYQYYQQVSRCQHCPYYLRFNYVSSVKSHDFSVNYYKSSFNFL